MQPLKQQEAENRATALMFKERQNTCKNGKFRIDTGTQDYKKEIFDFVIVNDGCKNARRNGSAWCQECSDKHNK